MCVVWFNVFMQIFLCAYIELCNRLFIICVHNAMFLFLFIVVKVNFV